MNRDNHGGDGCKEAANPASRNPSGTKATAVVSTPKGYRNGNLPGAANRCLQSRITGPQMGIDIFSGDDCVIHHDSQYQDKAECAHDVQADVERSHYPDRAKKTDRNTDENPERDGGTQEQGKQQNHQDCALCSPIQEDAETIFEDLRIVVPVAE